MRRQKLRAGAGRRDRPEEHPDDRPDRRRQDRDRAPAGAARAVAVHQGRGVEVHRGRLRRPRRRVDGARSRRARRRHGARRAARGSARARPSRTPRSGCSTCCCRRARRRAEAADDRATSSHAERARRISSTRRANDSASSCATAGSTSESVELDVREKLVSVVRDHHRLVGRRDRHQPQGHAAGPVPGAGRSKRRMKVPEALEYLVQEEEQKLIDMDSVARVGGRARRAGRHHLHRRDRQDRGARRRRARARRQPRRRAARHPADRRRHDREHQVRHGAHRPHPVHRRRRVPRVEAVRPDSRAAGPLSDSRRARAARQGRFRAHPHRAEERARQAVHGADGDRGHQAALHSTRRSIGSPTSRRA